MNFADAIRKIASESGNPPAGQPQESKPMTNPSIPAQTDDIDYRHDFESPEPTPPTLTSGNVVRLELFLNAEQMNAMLRAIMQGQHTVMTLREAASYLRLPSHTLEKMAQEGEVPSFTIEGRWRFPKPALDEWLSVRSHHAHDSDSQETQENVA